MGCSDYTDLDFLDRLTYDYYKLHTVTIETAKIRCVDLTCFAIKFYIKFVKLNFIFLSPTHAATASTKGVANASASSKGVTNTCSIRNIRGTQRWRIKCERVSTGVEAAGLGGC